MPEQIKLSVVVPTFNRAGCLKKLLISLAAQTYDHAVFEVIVVDDFSTDGTEEMINESSKKADFAVKYIKNDIKGQTRARNNGFKAAAGEIVVSTDSDIEADAGWLENGVRYFSDKDIAAVEGRIVAKVAEEGPFAHKLHKEEGGTYQTANMFYRSGILQKAGYLDEVLNNFQNHGSDYDLGRRITDSGGRIVFAPDAFVYHVNSKTSVKTMLERSLRSSAIPYLYKKHNHRLHHNLKMSLARIAGGVFTIGLLCSALLMNYPAVLANLLGAIYVMTDMLIPDFRKARFADKIKSIPTYGLHAAICLIAFMYGCIRFRVFPDKNIFRF